MTLAPTERSKVLSNFISLFYYHYKTVALKGKQGWFCPLQGIFGYLWGHFSKGQNPGILLSILQCTEQYPLPIKQLSGLKYQQFQSGNTVKGQIATEIPQGAVNEPIQLPFSISYCAQTGVKSYVQYKVEPLFIKTYIMIREKI